MHKMHVPAPPYLDVATPVSDFMTSLDPTKPFWRANWHIFNDMAGPWDLYTPPHIAPSAVQTIIGGSNVGRELVFRSEFQTLR
jgi:hypothetical protein